MIMCLHIPATTGILQLMRTRERPHTIAQNAVTFADGEISSAASVVADNPWTCNSSFIKLYLTSGYLSPNQGSGAQEDDQSEDADLFVPETGLRQASRSGSSKSKSNESKSNKSKSAVK
jgi:hypothetical protein